MAVVFVPPGHRTEIVPEVRVPQGTTIRTSTVGRQGSLRGGGTQIELRKFPEELDPDWFGEPQSLDSLIG